MRHPIPALALAAALAAHPAASAAQPNPFKLAKSGLKAVTVQYQYTGDLTGTATFTIDGERIAQRAQTAMKILGKTVATEEWSLTTPDSIYRADLGKKLGTVSPNPLPYFARAFDGLDGAGKKRFHQNIEAMAGMLARGFNLGQLAGGGAKTGTRTVAGQLCEERSFGGFSVCTMEKTPLVLHTKGSLVCVAFEQTATQVQLGAAPAEAFAIPAGITFSPDKHLTQPDSMARGFVQYLASEGLTDSIAKARAELEKARAEAAAKGQPAPEVNTAQLEAACQAMRDFDLGRTMADASEAWKREMAEAAKNAAKNAAVGGLKGLLKKPKIP